jgi:hypothetical protein
VLGIPDGNLVGMTAIRDAFSGTGLAEIQGLYGAFSFPERLLQKIWLRRDFNFAGARTDDGRTLRVVHPGKWNLLGGPDFRLARLRFDDGPEVVGDVELHLRAPDWQAHGHARDPAYDGVMLHVVLFPPDPGYVTRGADDRVIPLLVMLPLLHHDLEEYAADEAVESLSNRPTARVTNELAVFNAEELGLLLRHHALGRWRQRVHFAQTRVNRLGWDSACHHAALEVLGFRFNRAPMLRIASRWSLAAWCDGTLDLDEVLRSEAESWSVQGVRPANHPRTRLRQYAAWTHRRPNWPGELLAWLDQLPGLDPDTDTRQARRQGELVAVRERFATQVCGGQVGGTRIDNLICDAFLPLFGPLSEKGDRYGCWFHWFCGDVPPFVNAGLRQLAVIDGRGHPACHGMAQGLLGWLIEREVRR